MTKKYTAILFVFITLLALLSSASAECMRNPSSNAIMTINNSVSVPPLILYDSNLGWGDACNTMPDQYTVSFYKLGVCKEDPSSNDLTSCQFMLNSDAVNGVTHTIRYPNEAALATGDFEIAPDTYGYMVAILSNKLGITHTESFTVPLQGSTTSGDTCWTAGFDTAISGDVYTHNDHGALVISSVNSPTLECGAAGIAAPEVSYEVIDTMGEGGCGAEFAASNTPIVMSNGTANGSLLTSTNVAATDCINASRILWTIDLTTPLVVTETTEFTLTFDISGSVSVDAGSNAGIGTMVKMGADPFEATLTTR